MVNLLNILPVPLIWWHHHRKKNLICFCSTERWWGTGASFISCVNLHIFVLFIGFCILTFRILLFFAKLVLVVFLPKIIYFSESRHSFLYFSVLYPELGIKRKKYCLRNKIMSLRTPLPSILKLADAKKNIFFCSETV